MSAKEKEARKVRFKRVKDKGMYIAPSLITSLSFFCGFYSIVRSIGGDFYIAGWFIIFAALLDGLDGRVARLLGSSSPFGVEFDSLSDMTAFGIAPSVMMYEWVLSSYGKAGLMAAFLFSLSAALRLARFNSQSLSKPEENSCYKGRFMGMPTPTAAGILASVSVFLWEYFSSTDFINFWLVVLVYILGFLMISGIPYRSFKNLQTLSSSHQFHVILITVFLLFVVITIPNIIFLLVGITYFFSGPIEWFYDTKGLDLKCRLRSIFGISFK